jgi:enoyl-CoA hydratase
MDSPVSVRTVDAVTVITMDDGKVNALSPAMFAALNAAFDGAEAAGGPVILTGRPGRFSAGFDLKVLSALNDESKSLLRSGFEFTHRILSFPRPVVIACSGHAIAMGVFVLLSGDYRIGADGPFKITANEVSLGMTMPHAAVELCRQRLTPAEFSRAILLSEVYSPAEAVHAGLLDQIVPAESLDEAALEVATRLSALSMRAHAATKLRIREASLAAIKAAIEIDANEFRIAP